MQRNRELFNINVHFLKFFNREMKEKLYWVVICNTVTAVPGVKL